MNTPVKMQIADVAAEILAEKVDLIEGCRRLVKLFGFLDRSEWDRELFDSISAVESETEDLPVGELRSMWSPQALAAKDAEAESYEEQVRDQIYQACRGLIDKYGRTAGD